MVWLVFNFELFHASCHYVFNKLVYVPICVIYKSLPKRIIASSFLYLARQRVWLTQEIFLVYTDTDTVSVCGPYWHSVSTAHTQISYFRNTTTLRDTENHPFLKNFLNFSVISFKKSKVNESFTTRN